MESSQRRSIYMLMLVVTGGMMLARVANVEFLYEPSLFKAYPKRNWPKDKPAPQPSFGSNDRARWATVKALVEQQTFVIGQRIVDDTTEKGYRDEGILFSPGFGSVDVVLHPDRSEFFSTKPPMLTLIAAGEYWVLFHVFHKNLDEHKWEVVVPILICTNVLPLLLALWLLSRLIEAHGRTDWGRLFAFAVACFGTFLPTFAITLNNHVPAACCVVFSLYALLGGRGESAPPSETPNPEPTPGAPRLLAAGLFAGLAASMDLPSLALGGVLAGILLLRSPRGLIWFLPALAIPIAVQTYVNYRMIGTWEPIYAKFGGPWYEYAGSHWAKRHLPNPEGIDFAQEPKTVYALHLLAGHHGLFSLTPVWLLALGGLACSLGRDRITRLCHRGTTLILLVVIGYYIYKTNNYGGWTSGPRWFFWLTPGLILALIPMGDVLAGSRFGRGLAYLCLAISAFSVTYPWANPWRHPWIYQLCEYRDWIRY